jgi:hypothetical protein
MDPREALTAGRQLLDAVLLPKGFVFQEEPSGKSSGGTYASGKYAKGDRSLEIHFRYSLGLVTYHVGRAAITHEEYMHCLLGARGGNKYPGFSDDPIDAFRSLALDVEEYCLDFLIGPGEEFSRCVRTAGRTLKSHWIREDDRI